MAQSNVVRLLEGQQTAGSAASYDVTQARVALETTQLARQDAEGQANQALVQLAGGIGVSKSALDGVEFSFDDFKNFQDGLTTPEIRQQALFNRADVRGALADYAASQAALRWRLPINIPTCISGRVMPGTMGMRVTINGRWD